MKTFALSMPVLQRFLLPLGLLFLVAVSLLRASPAFAQTCPELLRHSFIDLQSFASSVRPEDPRLTQPLLRWLGAGMSLKRAT